MDQESTLLESQEFIFHFLSGYRYRYKKVLSLWSLELCTRLLFYQLLKILTTAEELVGENWFKRSLIRRLVQSSTDQKDRALLWNMFSNLGPQNEQGGFWFNLVAFKTFRDPLFHKWEPCKGFLWAHYSGVALICIWKHIPSCKSENSKQKKEWIEFAHTGWSII